MKTFTVEWTLTVSRTVEAGSPEEAAAITSSMGDMQFEDYEFGDDYRVTAAGAKRAKKISMGIADDWDFVTRTKFSDGA